MTQPYAVAIERAQPLAAAIETLNAALTAEQVADEVLRGAVERAFVGMAQHMVNSGSAGHAEACPR